jgi:hypothetical protein
MVFGFEVDGGNAVDGWAKTYGGENSDHLNALVMASDVDTPVQVLPAHTGLETLISGY